MLEKLFRQEYDYKRLRKTANPIFRDLANRTKLCDQLNDLTIMMIDYFLATSQFK